MYASFLGISEAPVPRAGSTTERDFAKLNLHMDIFHHPLRSWFLEGLNRCIWSLIVPCRDPMERVHIILSQMSLDSRFCFLPVLRLNLRGRLANGDY
jgi:hypothetical protein